jgi:hypothetical protein
MSKCCEKGPTYREDKKRWTYRPEGWETYAMYMEDVEGNFCRHCGAKLNADGTFARRPKTVADGWKDPEIRADDEKWWWPDALREAPAQGLTVDPSKKFLGGLIGVPSGLYFNAFHAMVMWLRGRENGIKHVSAAEEVAARQEAVGSAEAACRDLAGKLGLEIVHCHGANAAERTGKYIKGYPWRFGTWPRMLDALRLLSWEREGGCKPATEIIAEERDPGPEVLKEQTIDGWTKPALLATHDLRYVAHQFLYQEACSDRIAVAVRTTFVRREVPEPAKPRWYQVTLNDGEITFPVVADNEDEAKTAFVETVARACGPKTYPIVLGTLTVTLMPVGWAPMATPVGQEIK